MSDKGLYFRLRRAFAVTLMTGIIGAFLAISVGENTESVRGMVGASTVLAAIAVGFVLTAVSLILTAMEWRRRSSGARHQAGEDQARQ